MTYIAYFEEVDSDKIQVSSMKRHNMEAIYTLKWHVLTLYGYGGYNEDFLSTSVYLMNNFE